MIAKGLSDPKFQTVLVVASVMVSLLKDQANVGTSIRTNNISNAWNVSVQLTAKKPPREVYNMTTPTLHPSAIR